MILSNYNSLASKLGWENMQADVAIPAIDKIVTNYINLISDCIGDVISPDPDDTVAILMHWNSDSIFDLLVEDSGEKFGTSNLHEIRELIESLMREGFEFINAINDLYSVQDLISILTQKAELIGIKSGEDIYSLWANTVKVTATEIVGESFGGRTVESIPISTIEEIDAITLDVDVDEYGSASYCDPCVILRYRKVNDYFSKCEI